MVLKIVMAIASKLAFNIATADFLLICSFCRKVKLDGVWTSFSSEEEAIFHGRFSHGLCPKCMQLYYPEFVDD
ncbi:hypothetical protein NEF87_003789 [Candidatus Lokiarchaeum ossiferum]|uniref:Mut7-C RNAse domain-containing protein n=1 Tax=Candidatus Lokiarchaeum ossiferum TaxID=2951803 RepID=A0ABY6HYI8_9ARCH|nr:hypothetical protein NEF87_003789 [Candidatus Lokiarchaeum sp. B-35]